METDLKSFINDTLYPSLFNQIDRVFPQMEFVFKQRKGNWESTRNIDSTIPKKKKSDKCFISSKVPHRVKENGEGGSLSLIDLYMSLNHVDFITAVREMCSTIGLELPTENEETKQRYQEYKEKQNKLEASLERQKAALFSPEGKKALEYMKERGWSEEEIKEAELGFINTDEAAAINAQKGIGTDEYPLSIPLRTSGHLYSFKFRTLNKEIEQKKRKYLYIQGAEKELFNLTGIQQEHGYIVVVEGELDALHASVKGIKNMVATQGGGLTKNLIQQAKKRGIVKAVLLLDSDKAGKEFIERSIKVSRTEGIEAYVAVLPEGCKDVDEYLKNHSKEELEKVIESADTASYYLYEKRINEAIKIQEGEGNILSQFQYNTILYDVIEIANEAENETARDIILSDFYLKSGDRITKEAIQAVADRKREEKDILQQKNETKDAIEEAWSQYSRGNVQTALKVMGKASKELVSIDKKAKYSSLLSVPLEEEIYRNMRNKKEAIETLYTFSNMRGEKEVFSIPTGAITFVSAPTSHGKSTFLQNLALQMATNKEEGTIFYFTFEEDCNSVLMQMFNKYMNLELCNNYNSKVSNNLRAISHYFKTGEDKYIQASMKALFHQKEALFMQKLITSGKLKIIYEDYDSTELVEAIQYLSKNTKIKAVFVDYIQLLSKNGCRLQRNEELKEICKDLKNIAVELDIPLILAAQLNRDAKNPVRMHSQNIAEAADIERIANKIVCLWNTSFQAQETKESKDELEKLENRMNIKLGEPGNMYAKMTKNRGGIVNLEAVFTYNGNTGIIGPNTKKVPEEQNSLPFDSPYIDIQ